MVLPITTTVPRVHNWMGHKSCHFIGSLPAEQWSEWVMSRTHVWRKQRKCWKRCKQDGTGPLVALWVSCYTSKHRSHPSGDTDGKKIRSFLPMSTKHFVPDNVDYMKVRSLLVRERGKQKKAYDKGSKSLGKLSEGERVRIQQSASWNPAIAAEKHSDRSYTVKTFDGGMYVRNMCHFRKGFIFHQHRP